MADLIDRQKAIYEILRLTHYDTVRSLYEATVANKYEDGIIDAIDVIVGLTSAQPERKTGRWILKPNIYGVVYCSECDYELHTNNTNYCPNCGADMRGGDNDDNGTD